MSSWTFILTDTSYRPIGELVNASSRKVASPLNKLPTASLGVRLDHPLADSLMTTACYLKAYRRESPTTPKVLQFFGPVISAEETGDRDKATISINAVGAGWILAHRLAGKSADGKIFSSLTDRAQMVKQLIDATNTENETGIDTSIGTISAASLATYQTRPYEPITDVITDLSASFDGFDWRFTPIDNYDSTIGAVTGQKIGYFEASPTFGVVRPDALYEWGGGRSNIASYKRTVNRETQANQVFHNTTAGADAPGVPTVSAIDTASISDWKLLEDLAQADLTDATLRQKLVDEHVRVRKYPRQTIEFTPHVDDGTGRLPLFGTDYQVADRVRGRITYGDSVRFDGLIRVWGIAFDISDLGTEQQTLVLADE